MYVTKEDLIKFVMQYGEDYCVNFGMIEEVGVNTVLDGIQKQLNVYTLELQTDVLQAMHDYFGDGAFDNLYGRYWSGL